MSVTQAVRGNTLHRSVGLRSVLTNIAVGGIMCEVELTKSMLACLQLNATPKNTKLTPILPNIPHQLRRPFAETLRNRRQEDIVAIARTNRAIDKHQIARLQLHCIRSHSHYATNGRSASYQGRREGIVALAVVDVASSRCAAARISASMSLAVRTPARLTP